jgi:hypothetical protein
LKSPVKDIYLYDLEKFLISKSMSLNASWDEYEITNKSLQGTTLVYHERTSRKW